MHSVKVKTDEHWGLKTETYVLSYWTFVFSDVLEENQSMEERDVALW